MTARDRTVNAAAAVRNAVRSIKLFYEPQEEVRLALSEHVATAELGRGRPQSGFQLRAPSQSGKSTVLEAVAKEFNEDSAVAPGDVPVPYVRIEAEGNVATVAADILRGLGERFPYLGKPPARWDRVFKCIEKRNVRVIAFDEFHRAGRTAAVSSQIGWKIQTLLDTGLCGAAFVGEPAATDLFTYAPALRKRLDAPVHLPPLDWFDEEGRSTFLKFADDFDEALSAAGLTDGKSGLALDDVAEPLLEASTGLIGFFCRIVENATVRIARDGRTSITRDDLSDAVDEWAIGNGFIERNPFE